jgi:hypothetical protein
MKIWLFTSSSETLCVTPQDLSRLRTIHLISMKITIIKDSVNMKYLIMQLNLNHTELSVLKAGVWLDLC